MRVRGGHLGSGTSRTIVLTLVSNRNVMDSWVPLILVFSMVGLVIAVALVSIRNARAMRRDLNERFGAIQAQLERNANALADELLARSGDSKPSSEANEG